MTPDILSAASRWADRANHGQSRAATATGEVAVVRRHIRGAPESPALRPTYWLVLQGAISLTRAGESRMVGPGETFLAEACTTATAARCSAAEPLLCVVLDLDLALVADLAREMEAKGETDAPDIVADARVQATEVILRLIRLQDDARSLGVLRGSLIRELHVWLLLGPDRHALRTLSAADAQRPRLARAIAALQTRLAEPLRVEHLASLAGMSVSSFYEHFRSATTMTPLQYRKQLRLAEARRLMLSEGKSCAGAAFEVGYESVSQFTREYGRHFGLPPGRDVRLTQRMMESRGRRQSHSAWPTASALLA